MREHYNILFLCTGNFYRSSFAEIYFNWLAPREKLLWRADSRGLALDPTNALVFDPQQNRRVASPELVTGIKTFQKKQGLLDDGVLGPRTLEKLGGDQPAPKVLKNFAVQPLAK